MDYRAFAASLLLVLSHHLAIARARTQVTIFYETHCPDSQKFMVSQVIPALDRFKSEVTYELVPYGFADHRFVNGGLAFKCQHGKKECEGNTIHACAIKYHPQQREDVIRFAACTMQLGADVLKLVDECATRFKLDGAELRRCADSREGIKLLQEMGDRTGVGARVYSPTRRKFHFIPSTFIDGQAHIEESVADLGEAICKHATVRPRNC